MNRNNTFVTRTWARESITDGNTVAFGDFPTTTTGARLIV